MLPIRTILHPTDFSEHSERAFALACALARDYGAKLMVLHVTFEPMLAGDPLAAYADFSYPELKAKLEALRPHDARVVVEHCLVEGHPADEIVRFADDHDCDLIMMGTHGLSGLAHLFMGSVAELVMRKARCPVLTVRAPAPHLAPSPARKSFHNEPAEAAYG